MMFDPGIFKQGVILQKDFFKFMDDLRKTNIELPRTPDIFYGEVEIESDSAKVQKYEENIDHKLNFREGYSLMMNEKTLLVAYDESIMKFSALEGKAAYVSHSLVYLHQDQYYPLNKLTLAFVTGSEKIMNKVPSAIKTNPKWGIDTTLNVEISKQKRQFLEENSYDNSILFIDGPLIAGDGLATFRGIVKDHFLKHNILPVFLVKNSNSDLIIRNFPELKKNYNSDLHMAHDLLKEGERTRFYIYTDSYNVENSKVFCYLKFKNRTSPLRIEIPTEIYKKNLTSIKSVLNLIYYLLLAQGDYKNPQVRLVAVAEKYARATLSLINFNKSMLESGLTPTMNERRGFE